MNMACRREYEDVGTYQVLTLVRGTSRYLTRYTVLWIQIIQISLSTALASCHGGHSVRLMQARISRILYGPCALRQETA